MSTNGTRVAIAAPASVVEYGTRRVLVVAAVMAAALMQSLDSTITNVALPTIQGSLGAGQDEATWVVTAYTIASITVMPIAPWLQMRLGRRNYFIASIAGFTLASLACGSATSLDMLILSRIVQGLFGGGLMVSAQAIMRDTFPPRQLAASQGIFALGAVMGPAIGPPFGGFLVDNLSWNWCFDVNVVPGAFAAVTLFLLLRDPQAPRRMPIDVAGIALLAATLGSMQYVLTEGERYYWLGSPAIDAMTAVGVLAGLGFAYNELRLTAYPVVDLRVLAQRSVWSGALLAGALGMLVIGNAYVTPQLTQGALDFTPTRSGLLFVIFALPVMFGTPAIVALLRRVDPRLLLLTGFTLAGLGALRQSFIITSQASFWTFALPMAMTGLGAALLFIPLTVAVLSATSPADGPKAAAFVNLAMQLGGSFSVALLDVVIDQRMMLHSTALAGASTLAAPAVRTFLQTHPVTELASLLIGQSVILSYADASFVVGVIALASIPLILLLRRRPGSVSLSHVEVGG